MGKYFKYAIGEILLVVIGILIALQINNSNENKKDRIYEHKMLRELKKAIDKDIAYTQDHILDYRTREPEKSVDYFKRLLKEESVDRDSLYFYFDRIDFGISFQINQGPYEALKSVGLDKVSNDSLRSSIQRFYDFLVPRIEQLVQWNEEEKKEMQKPLKNLFFDGTKYAVDGTKVNFYRSLVSNNFWREPNFLELLRISEERLTWRRNQFEQLIEYLKILKTLINKELEAND